MKFSSIALFAALAASVSASPIRVYALSSEPIPSIEEISFGGISIPQQDQDQENQFKALPISFDTIRKKPCHGEGSSSRFGPLRSWFGNLGSGWKNRHQDYEREREESLESVNYKLLNHFKEHFHEVEDKVVPLLEGGSIRLHPLDIQESELTLFNDDKDNGLDRNHHHAHAHKHGNQHEHGHGHRHRHGWMANTLPGRLQKALNNLKPFESIVLAFVIGAGLGSILHLFFMLCLLSFRYFKYGRSHSSREERISRRENRKSRKNGNSVRFADQVQYQEQEELLPAYEEQGENVGLVRNEKSEQA
ncbi:uncharacterized protein L201_005127 [Kwoniella dendrophila CBS 6074]|uniref:Uncharacterized protein n=1 Tax=Kwoniella dendrophila CBS 6074 TaxID=1295534 RepID=A0AAX4JYD5_9TREE